MSHAVPWSGALRPVHTQSSADIKQQPVSDRCEVTELPQKRGTSLSVEFLREKGNGFHLEGVVFFSIGVEKGFGAKTVNGIGNGLVETLAVG